MVLIFPFDSRACGSSLLRSMAGDGNAFLASNSHSILIPSSRSFNPFSGDRGRPSKKLKTFGKGLPSSHGGDDDDLAFAEEFDEDSRGGTDS